MFFDLCRSLSSATPSTRSQTEINAIVESTCLHARVLIDILTSKKSHKPDDIRLEDLLPGFRHPSVEHLKREYGSSSTPHSPCWILNKMLAHPTLQRGSSYDYTEILKRLLPLVANVWSEVQKQYGKLDVGVDSPRLIDPCAKTSC